MSPSAAQAQRVAAHYDRAVADLVDAHAKLARSPLVLAVRFDASHGLDVHLLEVIENFPGNDDDPLFTVTLPPNERFLILGELHLTLASPAQLTHAIEQATRREKTPSSALITAARKHGQLVFLANAPAPRAREAKALARALALP